MKARTSSPTSASITVWGLDDNLREFPARALAHSRGILSEYEAPAIVKTDRRVGRFYWSMEGRMPIEQDRSQYRHERILEAATRIFSQKGYHDAAMDDIAVESRTSKGGLYFHFPNKQTLFLALLDQMIALLRARAEAAIAE